MYSETHLQHGGTVWRSRNSAGGAVVAADGCVDLILRGGHISVAGPSTRWLTTGRDGASGSLGLRVPQGRAGHLLRIDLNEIADQLVPLDSLVDRGLGRRLHEAMRPLEAGSAPIGALSALVSEAAGAHRWSEAVRSAASHATPAREVAPILSGSERSFRRNMLSTFGYGYATLVRLQRVRRARTLLVSGAPVAAAAAGAGFADQPHLSREFRRLVGQSPAQFAFSSA